MSELESAFVLVWHLGPVSGSSVGIINIKPPDMTATAAEKDVFRLDVVHKNRSNRLSISKLH